MTADYPRPDQMAALRSLWKAAFGDEDAFLDLFFSTAYDPRRCRCVTAGESVAAALYWFDVSCRGEKMAYLYAVATHPDHRGRGMCRSLMEDTRRILTARNYAAAILVPQEEGLISMYGKMGYVPATKVTEFHAFPGAPLPLKKLTALEYAAARRAFLSPDGVVQEGENLAFLAAQADFYTGEGFLAAVTKDGSHLHCHELLGKKQAAAGIVSALGCQRGFFRTPGVDTPFAMVLPLKSGCPRPRYFGIAFD